jgi:DNA-binding NtrC family response regulator
MSKCVILREDEADLAGLVRELLEDAGYTVIHVITVEDLLVEAARRVPCIALVDGMSPSSFDLWWLGPVLSKLGVPPVAFTAHASAREEFAADARGFVGVVSKPFDADEFVNLVDSICWEESREAASRAV